MKQESPDELKKRIKELEHRVKELEQFADTSENVQKFRALYENAPLPYQSLNEQGFVIDVNPAWLKTLGYESKEVIGAYFGDFLHEDWKTHFKKNFPEFKRKGYVHDVQFRMRHKKGHYIDVTFEGCIGYDTDGSFRQTYCVFKDITEENRIYRQIKEAKEFFDAVFQSIQDGISVLNKDLTILYVNPVMEKWYAANMPLVGKKCHQGYHSSDTPCELCPSIRCMKTRETEFNVIPGSPDPDSPVKWLELYSYPIIDSDSGEITGVVEFVRDITQRVQNEMDLKRTRNLLEKSQRIAKVGSWELDLTRNNLLWSDEVYRIFGLKPQEFTATYEAFLNLVHPRDRLAVSNAYESSIEEGRDQYEIENRIIRKDNGKIRHLYEKCDHIRDESGNIIKSIGMVQDITERKEYEDRILSFNEELQAAEEELKTSNDELKDINQRLEKQKEEMEKAKEKAEESDRLKSAFLANMSHEIRTPMNGIMGFAQMLQKKEFSREKQKKFLNIIESRTHHLLQIINDIVDVSKIEANLLTLDFQYFYLNDVMRELYSIYKNEIENKGKNQLRLKLHLGVKDRHSYILSDLNRFRQIMDNLLGNAMKFTHEGSIEFGYKVQPGNTLLFYVSDTGIGISPEQQQQIFERFRQAENGPHGMYEGTGLGLTISRNLAELLGGSLWVESEKDKGSVFYFTLPYKQGNTGKNAQETEKAGEVQCKEGKTLLIVEDDPTSRHYMKELLEPNGFELIMCETGQEGLKAFRTNTAIDLILMDIKLPDIQGLEVSRKIRSMDSGEAVPIIAQTAYAMSEDARKSQDAGCDDYISKPIDGKNLLEKINRLL